MSPDDLETYSDELTRGLVKTLAGLRRIEFGSFGEAEALLDGLQKIAWVADSINQDRTDGLRSA